MWELQNTYEVIWFNKAHEEGKQFGCYVPKQLDPRETHTINKEL